MRGFVNGVVFTLAVLIAGAIVGVFTGALYPGADQKPSQLERMASQKSLAATIDRATAGLNSPLQPTNDTLLAGVHLYANDCAVCHGAADGKASTLAKGFYIRAPQLAKHGVEDDPPSETYWKVAHGIRFTAMPSFAATLTNDEVWQVSLFLSKMDKLPPEVETAWKAIPSVAPSPGTPEAANLPSPEPSEPGPAEPGASSAP